MKTGGQLTGFLSGLGLGSETTHAISPVGWMNLK